MNETNPIKSMLGEKAEEVVSEKQEFICDNCGKVCGSLAGLNSHKRSHKPTQVANVRERIPIGRQKLKLTASVPDGYVGHIFNDAPGELEEALQAGWDFINDRDGKITLGEDDGNTDIGSRVSRVVDRGNGRKGFLMVLKKELFEEDKKEKEKIVDKIASAIDDGILTGTDKNKYVPDGAIDIQYNYDKQHN